MKTTSEQEYHEIDCPGCGDKIKIPKQPATHTVSVNAGFAPEDIEKAVERAIEKKMPKEPEKPKEKIIAPKTMPKYLCKGKGCEGHTNPDYAERPKKRCNNCSMWGGPADTPKCPQCGSDDFEELDDDDLDSIGIPKPKEHEHEHE